MKHIRREMMARRGFVGFLTLAFVASLVLTGAADAPSQTFISEAAIAISLPIYIVSLLAAVGFGWTVAKWDSARERRLAKLEILQELAEAQRCRADEHRQSEPNKP